jgi:hypothetical protein
MLPDFHPPAAEDEYDHKLLRDIETLGWHVVPVVGDESGPQFSFSVGLYCSFGHPEIMIMGLAPQVAHELINTIAVRIVGGEVFVPAERIDDLVESFPCIFIPISIDHYQDNLGYGIWYYGSLKQPFPALQLVWPDKQGLFPWDAGYDVRFNKLQRLLDRT